jgi:hypothetical protein
VGEGKGRRKGYVGWGRDSKMQSKILHAVSLHNYNFLFKVYKILIFVKHDFFSVENSV